MGAQNFNSAPKISPNKFLALSFAFLDNFPTGRKFSGKFPTAQKLGQRGQLPPPCHDATA